MPQSAAIRPASLCSIQPKIAVVVNPAPADIIRATVSACSGHHPAGLKSQTNPGLPCASGSNAIRTRASSAVRILAPSSTNGSGSPTLRNLSQVARRSIAAPHAQNGIRGALDFAAGIVFSIQGDRAIKLSQLSANGVYSCGALSLAGSVFSDLINSLGLADPWTYLIVFLAISLLMMWRLEAMLDHGLEGTALGTLIMPYCSGLGNLIFVAIMVARNGSPREVMTNCLVNNVTNLTLLLGLPALCWGLAIMPAKAGSGAKGKKPARPAKSAKSGGTEGQLNRLSLLLTLTAVEIFTGDVWALGRDGKLDQTDGLILIGLFLFWQCFQVFDVLKYNVRQRVSFGFMFYVDLVVVIACAYLMYETIDWLVTWLSAQKHGLVSAGNLGWMTGWLMVLPNAMLALYWGWKRRADVVYASQVGDGHICIPLCLGLFAMMKPLPVTAFFQTGLLILLGSVALHGILLLVTGGLPRWAGAVLTAAYGWFVWQGLLN